MAIALITHLLYFFVMRILNTAPVICIITNRHSVLHLNITDSIIRHARKHTRWIIDVENIDICLTPEFRAHRFDGLISTTIAVPEIVAHVNSRRTPFVGFSATTDHCRLVAPHPLIHFDNPAVAHIAADHLLQQGYRWFAFFYVQPGTIMSWDKERRDAFVDYLEKYGCTVFTRTVYRQPKLQLSFFRTTAQWLKRLPKPIGIFCANDARARLVIEACRMAGIRSPEEVGVSGVDNDETICNNTKPPLTSVTHDYEKIGAEIVRLMGLLLKGRRLPQTNLAVKPAGIESRGSTDTLVFDNPKLRQAIRYIRNRINAPLQVSDVARQLGVSRSTLDRLAAGKLGCSIHSVIADQRLQQVQHLLKTTAAPLKEIAARTGFSSEQYLCLVFARRFKQSPGRYRQACR